MFETIKQNIQKYRLINKLLFYIIFLGIAIVLKPFCCFSFYRLSDHRLSCFAWVVETFEAYRFKKENRFLKYRSVQWSFFPDLSSNRLCFCTCKSFLILPNSSWISCYHQQLASSRTSA